MSDAAADLPDPIAPPGADPSQGAEPSFEASTERLARVVEELERGDLPLERALSLFEEGVRLAQRAQARLDRAERRVEELLAIDPKGVPVTRPVPGYGSSPAGGDE
jgi:exodeoxyribonuclease VII small subunit